MTYFRHKADRSSRVVMEPAGERFSMALPSGWVYRTDV
jgi:hypothetical protein